MKIIRVFARKTSYTPNDEYCFFGEPPFPALIPPHDEVHISCTFTWDKKRARELKFQWEIATEKPVKLGGPAFLSPAEDFIQGLYMRQNIIFTTRGCNNRCEWCIVPKLEGTLKKIYVNGEVPVGNVIQDNNFLQADKAHKDKVFDMLKTQSGICFRGGLEPDLIDDHFVGAIQNLRIKELWLACDTYNKIPLFAVGCEKLARAGFAREKVKCYCLSYGQNMDEDEARCREVYKLGAMPYVQLYQHFEEEKIVYDEKWKSFQRRWARPAIIKSRFKQESW